MKTLLALMIFPLAALLPAHPAREYIAPPALTTATTARSNTPQGPVFEFATDELWSYLRTGLTYLESPTPALPPEAVLPTYIHPDGRGFGAYGFSPEAYEDVQRIYPYFRAFSWEQLLRSQRLYDLANRALCDWMLRNLQEYIPAGASKEQIFSIIHKAWNLGVGGFRKGREVVPSRARRAQEFLNS
jgi:hypothetical protein